jgi:lysine-specific permease
MSNPACITHILIIYSFIGLFLSSGANLAKAGPAGLLIAYCIIGFIVYWIAVQLGEISSHMPVKS